jgi:hypothetical protein
VEGELYRLQQLGRILDEKLEGETIRDLLIAGAAGIFAALREAKHRA